VFIVDKSIHICIIERPDHHGGLLLDREPTMETGSMLVAGILLFASIYGLTGMLLRRPQPRNQEAGAGTQESEANAAMGGGQDPPTPEAGNGLRLPESCHRPPEL
jgi:hypothetical protein